MTWRQNTRITKPHCSRGQRCQADSASFVIPATVADRDEVLARGMTTEARLWCPWKVAQAGFPLRLATLGEFSRLHGRYIEAQDAYVARRQAAADQAFRRSVQVR